MATQVSAWKTNAGELVASDTQAWLCDLAAVYCAAHRDLERAKEKLLDVLDLSFYTSGRIEGTTSRGCFTPLGTSLVDASKVYTEKFMACQAAYDAYSALERTLDFDHQRHFHPETPNNPGRSEWCHKYQLPAHRAARSSS